MKEQHGPEDSSTGQKPPTRSSDAPEETLGWSFGTQGPAEEEQTLPARSRQSQPGAEPTQDPDKTLPPEAASSAGIRKASRLAGQYVGPYRILEKIAEGGMGIVYKARHERLQRVVALKMIKAGVLAGEEELLRFQQEVQAAAQLDHPGIVPLYEVGQWQPDGDSEPLPYFAMGYVEGTTLAHRLLQGPLPPEEAALLIRQVAEAIHYAHQQGIVHRDLKPANILLPEASQTAATTGSSASRGSSSSLEGNLDAYPKVSDFGLAKRMDADSELTRTGQVMGTPNYMPPEQARGEHEQIGPTSDVYALGAVLYATLTGTAPFQAASPLITLRHVLSQDPVPPRQHNPAIPKDLETICLKCLEKEPQKRYGSAQLLAEDLGRYLAGEPITARPVGTWERMWRWCRRNPATAVALGVGMLAVVILLALALVVVQLRYSQQVARTKALQLQAAQREGELQREQLQAAEKLAQQRQQLAQVQRYFGLVGQAQSLAAARRPGWTAQTLEKLAQAARMPAQITNPLQLRSEMLRTLAGPDLQLQARVAMPAGYRAALVQFRPDGKQLAVATLRNRFVLKVLLCRVPSGEVEQTLSVRASPSWQLKSSLPDGIREMAYIQQGKKLVVLTRSGWLCCWDLQATPPKRSDVLLPVPIPPLFVFHPVRPEVYYRRQGAFYRWNWQTKEPPIRFQDDVGEHATYLALSPQGDLLVATFRGQALLYETRSLKPIARLPCEDGRAAGFGPDGKLLALVDSRRQTIRLIDTRSAQVVQDISFASLGHFGGSQVQQIEFLGRSGLLAVSSTDQQLRLWDLTTGRLALSTLYRGQDRQPLGSSPQGRFLAVVEYKHASLYRVQGPETRHVLGPCHGGIASFSASDPTGVVAVMSSRGSEATLELYDLRKGRLLAARDLPLQGARMALSADGSRIVFTDSQFGLLHARMNLAAAEQASTLFGQRLPSMIAFSGTNWFYADSEAAPPRRGKLSDWGVPWPRVSAAVAMPEKRFYLFYEKQGCLVDWKQQRVVGPPRKASELFPGMPFPVEFAVRLGKNRVGFGHEGEFYEYDLGARRVVKGPLAMTRRFGHPDSWRPQAAMCVSPTDGIFWFFSGKQMRSYWYEVDRSHRPFDSLGAAVPALASVDQVDALCMLSEEDMPTLCSGWRWERAGDPRHVSLDHGGNTLWLVSEGTLLTAYRAAPPGELHRWSNEIQARVAGHGDIHPVAVGKKLAAACMANGTLWLFRLPDRREHRLRLPHPARCVAWNPEETQLACGLENGEVLICSQQGKPLHRRRAHQGMVLSLDYSPCGRFLVSGSSEGELAVWQVGTQGLEPLAVFPPQQSSILQVQFLREKILVRREYAQYVEMWNWHALCRHWARHGLFSPEPEAGNASPSEGKQ